MYLIGCVIGGRVSDTNSEEYDRMDGQLVCRYDNCSHDNCIVHMISQCITADVSK